MKRIYRGWLFAGLTALGPPGVSIAYGQASPQYVSPYAATSPQGAGSESGYGGSPASSPRGGTSAFPQGDQSPVGGISASPQGQIALYGSVGSRIPYPRKADSFPIGNQPLPGSIPMASPQGTPAGGYGTTTRPGSAPAAAAPGKPGPGGLSGAQGPAGPSGQIGGGPGAGASREAGAAAGMPGAGPEAGGALGAAPGAAGAPTAPVEVATEPPGARSTVLEEALAGFTPETTAGAQAAFTPNMIGDQGPMFLRQSLRFPPVPSPLPPGAPRPGNNPFTTAGRSVAAIVPAVRGIKISDNQFPRPVDRIWISYNYYDGVNQGINNEFRTPIKDMQVNKETFGIEKTFLDQQASIGFRLPLNTLNIMTGFPGVGGTSTSLGNFDSFVKYALYDDGRNFLSVGLDLNYPTGPKSFAGYPTLLGMNPFEIQPFMGYIIQRDRVYLQGFNSIAVPTDRRAATMYYCDIGLGYFVYRSRDPRSLISFIVPTFETHLNIPLNWVGFQPHYIGGTPDVVDLTFALNVGMSNKAILSAAYIRPVTGPLPFTGEFALMLNIPFGRGAGRAAAFTTPPVIGQ